MATTNKLRTTVYRKPTHTDRLLDRLSYNRTSHNATTIQTLARRAQLLCDLPDSFEDESKYLENVFINKNYNKNFVRRNTYNNTEPNVTNNYATPVTTATIPYIKCTSETFARIPQPYNIRVAHYHHFATTTNQRKGQRRTKPQTWSSLQDQMLRLPGHLYW